MDVVVQRAVLALLEAGGRGALATVTRASGSTPQVVSARMLLRPDGTLVGTVGGGAVEHAATEALRACVRSGKAEVLVWDLGRDLGMCCGGRMEVLVEPVEAMPRLLIFGAGHVGHATARVAAIAGFRVTVVDDREGLADGARFPDARVLAATPREARTELAPTEHDFLLVATHDHLVDEEALDTYARLPHRYIGLIGSRRKVLRILQRIAARGALPKLERVYAPVGLDLGAVSPEEIAVSVVAEMVALRYGRTGAPHLRCLDDPAIAKLLAEPDASVDAED